MIVICLGVFENLWVVVVGIIRSVVIRIVLIIFNEIVIMIVVNNMKISFVCFGFKFLLLVRLVLMVDVNN